MTGMAAFVAFIPLHQGVYIKEEPGAQSYPPFCDNETIQQYYFTKIFCEADTRDVSQDPLSDLRVQADQQEGYIWTIQLDTDQKGTRHTSLCEPFNAPDRLVYLSHSSFMLSDRLVWDQKENVAGMAAFAAFIYHD